MLERRFVEEINNGATVDTASVELIHALEAEFGDVVTAENFDSMVNSIKEENTMKNENTKKEAMKAAITASMAQMNNAIKNVKVETGEDKNDFMNRADGAINEIKDAMGPVLVVLDDALGCTALKEEICRIIYREGENCKSKDGFFKMARKIRTAVRDNIELLSLVDPDDKFGTVAALRVLDDDGNIESTQTIWAAFAKSIVWVVKKVIRKLRDWNIFSTDAEKNFFGAVGASIAQVFAVIGNVIKNIATLAGNAILYVASYTASAVLNIGYYVIAAIKWVWGKIKGGCSSIKAKFTKEEEFEDEEFFDDEEEIVVE